MPLIIGDNVSMAAALCFDDVAESVCENFSENYKISIDECKNLYINFKIDPFSKMPLGCAFTMIESKCRGRLNGTPQCHLYAYITDYSDTQAHVDFMKEQVKELGNVALSINLGRVGRDNDFSINANYTPDALARRMLSFSDSHFLTKFKNINFGKTTVKNLSDVRTVKYALEQVTKMTPDQSLTAPLDYYLKVIDEKWVDDVMPKTGGLDYFGGHCASTSLFYHKFYKGLDHPKCPYQFRKDLEDRGVDLKPLGFDKPIDFTYKTCMGGDFNTIHVRQEYDDLYKKMKSLKTTSISTTSRFLDSFSGMFSSTPTTLSQDTDFRDSKTESEDDLKDMSDEDSRSKLDSKSVKDTRKKTKHKRDKSHKARRTELTLFTFLQFGLKIVLYPFLFILNIIIAIIRFILFVLESVVRLFNN